MWHSEKQLQRHAKLVPDSLNFMSGLLAVSVQADSVQGGGPREELSVRGSSSNSATAVASSFCLLDLAAKPICLLCLSIMSSPGGFASLSDDSLRFLSNVVRAGQLHVSPDPIQWYDSRIMHVEACGPWTSSFECFLLDNGLPVDLNQPCRDACRVTQFKMIMPCPQWPIVKGTHFGCHAVLDLQGGQLSATVEDVKDVWPCGQFDACAPPAFVHMFAGAFSGWHQAQNWLSSHNHICHPSFTVGIEHDFVCASYAAASCKAVLINRDEKCVLHHRHVMLRCDVQDDWWLQWLHHGINLMCTISFPCQPFSKGGKSSGIEVQDGRVLVEALALCRRIQPVALALENEQIIISLLVGGGYPQTKHDRSASTNTLGHVDPRSQKKTSVDRSKAQPCHPFFSRIGRLFFC